MRRVPTVLLQHDCRADRHFDWLILDPTLPRRTRTAAAVDERCLWTARLALPTAAWQAAAALRLTVLPHHRRNYLHYQGPVSAARGRVRRLDAGHAIVRLWTATRIELDLSLDHFTGSAALRRLAADRWIAVFAASRPAN